jgi:alpha-glucosidase (family GH31 glycosyl hydrolase)
MRFKSTTNFSSVSFVGTGGHDFFDWLVGSDILVKAVGESEVESVQVYFPGGDDVLWFSVQLDGTFYPGTGLTEIPVTIDRVN